MKRQIHVLLVAVTMILTNVAFAADSEEAAKLILIKNIGILVFFGTMGTRVWQHPERFGDIQKPLS